MKLLNSNGISILQLYGELCTLHWDVPKKDENLFF